MAKIVTNSYTKKNKKTRKGINAKSKTSSLKTSKLYKKKYRGQGR
jgi:hypothetical protein